MRRVHTLGWRRTRRYDEPSNDLGPLSPHQSCPAYIIDTRGYNSREGQVEIETAVTSMTSLARATPARHPASIYLPLVSSSQIDSSRHVPTICSLILRS